MNIQKSITIYDVLVSQILYLRILCGTILILSPSPSHLLASLFFSPSQEFTHITIFGGCKRSFLFYISFRDWAIRPRTICPWFESQVRLSSVQFFKLKFSYFILLHLSSTAHPDGVPSIFLLWLPCHIYYVLSSKKQRAFSQRTTCRHLIPPLRKWPN